MSTTKKVTVTALAAALGVTTLAACGGESKDSASDGGPKLQDRDARQPRLVRRLRRPC